MRRTLTITLLLAMELPFAMSFAQGAATDPLPICCRRLGAHHCAAMQSEPPGSVPMIGQRQQPCPYRAFILQWRADEYHPAGLVQNFQQLLSYRRAPVQAVIDYVVSDARTHHKRGPPSPLS